MESTGVLARAPCDSLQLVTGSKTSRPSRVVKSPKGIASSCRVKADRVSSSSKGRKKSKVRGAVHPSVRLAEEWTNRAEQVEELRAKELYPGEGSEFVECISCTKLPRGVTKRSKPWPFGLDTAKSGVARSALSPAVGRRLSRPWEWSTKDCEDVLADAIGALPHLATENVDLAPPGCGRDLLDIYQNPPGPLDCSSAANPTQTPTGGGCPSASSTGGGMVVIPSENAYDSREDARQRAEARSVEHLEPLDSKRVTCSSSDVDVAVSYSPARELNRHHDSLTRKRRVPPTEMRHEVSKGGSRRRLSGPPKVQATVTSDAILKEDERKARELSAELNRNNPRRHRASGGETSVSNGSTVSPPLRCDDERGNPTDSSSLESRGEDVLFSLGEASRQECENEGVDGTWPLVVGASAEVWWDDAWYRCTMSSVSTSEERGVLEFLPYRRKGRAWGREYSTELDLRDWVRAGHLARPGTHLEWD